MSDQDWQDYLETPDIWELPELHHAVVLTLESFQRSILDSGGVALATVKRVPIEVIDFFRGYP